MQLGARWRVGEPPHRSLPDELREVVAEHEAAQPDAQAWTLTWLEGKPRLALDDVPLDADPELEAEDDDWLS